MIPQKSKKQARKVRRQQRVRQLMFEKSEPRLMLNADWHNPFEARDVNADAQVSPSDALSVINTLNSEGSRPLGATAAIDPFFDVSNDGFVSPIDALIVINHLNSIGSSIVDGVLPEAKDAIDSVRLVPIDEFADQNRLSFRVEHHLSAPLSQALVDDTFSVYVVSEGDPSKTLLHRSEPGDSVFALHSTGFEIVAGISSWDDQYLTIDLSRVDPAEEPALLFQFMNGDSHVRSMVRTSEFSFDSLGNADQGSLLAPERTEQPGGPVQVDSLSATNDVELVIENESYDSNSDKYSADLSLFNSGVGIGREVIVTFDGIPEGASLTNASGFTPSGLPYINFENAISSGGLQNLSGSNSVAIRIDNPGGHFLKVSTAVLGGANNAPKLAPVSPVVILPGASEKVQFQATDDDGDDLQFTLQTTNTEPPGGYLNGSGELLLKPTPDDVGSYEFVVTVSDGAATASQTLRVDVVEDPVTSTRVSGKILDTSEQPLSGMQVEIGNVVTTTDNNGDFVLDLGSGPLFSDTLRIRGDLASGSDPYPFIAEKLPYMFGRDVIPGVNNVIGRPIYLPVLDVENAVQIDPASRTIVDTDAIPLASVTVEAGNLVNQQRLPFEGSVSITEVPIDRTPAALPPNLIPDMVVTIQPGEMSFNQPAPLTLPNRGGYEPGTAMALWSIDPTTGEFRQVGEGEVSSDGERIETTVDGIRNSSWHFFVPPPEVIVPPAEKIQNQKQGCASCEAAEETTSQIELHSGALRETHTTLAYRSLGQDRAVTLHYNSQHAAPKPIVHFGADNAVYRENRLLAARLSFQSGDFSKQVPGFSGGGLADDGYHFWTIPEDGGNIEAALQGNLSDFPSGIYSYTLNHGFLTRTGDTFNGTLVESLGEVVSVNTSGSPFGVGWEIGGVQRIVSSPTGKLLLIDGDGSTLVFEPGPDANSPYVSPPGDFTTLARNDDFTFTRTTKEQTVFEFSSSGHLESITDRNGNTTQHVYNGGLLTAIVDPVGLETRFVYEQDRIESIVGPGGRTAQLSYDDDGNLRKIVDPDGSSRTFTYDSNHQLVQEIDKRGNVERTKYGFHGRAMEASRKDGSILSVLPLQSGVLHSPVQTSNPQKAPVANVASDDIFAKMVSARGEVKLTQLDQQGQNSRSRDSLGPLGEVVRGSNNLVTQSIDARGFSTYFDYDDSGNVVRMTDDLIRSRQLSFDILPEESFFTSRNIRDVHLVDLNGDQLPEAVVAPNSGRELEIYSNLNGSFALKAVINTSSFVSSLSTGDFNGDGMIDIAHASFAGSVVSVHLGTADGTFSDSESFDAVADIRSLNAADFNGDSFTDLLVESENDIRVAFGSATGVGLGSVANLTLRTPANDIAVADLDDDGFLDVIIAYEADDEVTVVWNGSDGFGAQTTVTDIRAPSEIDVADFNNDGQIDLAVIDSENRVVSVYLTSSENLFQNEISFPAVGAVSNLAVGDFEGDGRIELAFSRNPTGGGFGGESFIPRYSTRLLGLQEDRLVLNASFEESLSTYLSGFSDLDNDGKDELLTHPARNYFSIRRDVSGQRLNTTTLIENANFQYFLSQDINSDERPDLVSRNLNSNSIEVHYRTDGPSYTSPVSYSLGGDVGGFGGGSVERQFILRDLDDDGQKDLEASV